VAAPEAPVARLREAALPYLEELVDRLGETVNVMVLAGSEVRLVATAECAHVLRVGDRTGRSLPAHLASGGKAILAALATDDLAQVLRGLGEEKGEEAAQRLRKELNLVRRRGFAVNDQATEAGLTAVGVAIPDPAGTLRAAVSIAVPTVRYSRELLPVWTAALTGTATAVGTALTRP
jgi:DNA-binding IclR family transcriptional regulator